MFHRLIAASLVFSSLALGGAQAGPWLRGKGSSFLSFSVSATPNLDARGAAYLEFGITATSTVGLDLGYSRSNTGSELGYGTLFIRRAIGPSDWSNKFAYELGLGATYGGPTYEMHPHLKTGLTWGRGFQIHGKGGWLTADAAVLWDFDHNEHVKKIDTTVGFNFTDTTAGIIQFNFAHQADEAFGFLEPSFVFSPNKSGLKIQLGLSTPFDEPDQTALKLGLWQEF